MNSDIRERKDMQQYIPFDAGTVSLEGSNLIEASAGTGKTYSIALLALRLILEDNIAVEQILMVTFTKAAVAELQERVRLFIRMAGKAAQGFEIKDKTIAALVQKAIDRDGEQVITDRLKDAVLLLDEVSIMTIHGFCQQTLNEFAFETGQLFGAEMFTDLDSIVEQEVNAFWRSYITTMEVELLQLLGYESLRQDIRGIVRQQLEGKQYEGYEPEAEYLLSAISLQQFNSLQEEIQQQSKMQEVRVLQAFEQHQQAIAAVCHSSKARSKKEFIASLGNAQEFLHLLNNTKPNVLTAALPEDFTEVYNEARNYLDQAAELVQLHFKKQLYYFAIQEITKSVQHFLLKNNLLGYNDLIQNLYKALTDKENPALVAALQEKYKAIFVDEFQDTDREQYEIFRKAFPSPTITFLIGDPKQSIYAWRKADIFTYFMARSAVDKRYSMNVNYRSAAPLIEAMNRFFLPEPDFDTFYFGNNVDNIRYFPVESPETERKGLLLYQGRPDIPLSVFEGKNKDAIQYGVAKQIQALLTDADYQITENSHQRRIRPSDIGILVRSNKDSLGIKNYLAQQGIPAVTINDARILGTVEALEVLYLLEAIWEPTLAAINRALLSGFCSFNTEQLRQLDEEKVLSFFQQYKETWTKDGVYPSLMRFVRDFRVRSRLLNQEHANGERTTANLYQLIELLNQAQQHRELSPEELISWLKRGINGMETQGDEYQVRMESDEEAVKIITIHKSKGLEYNIVFAPFLDMNTDGNYRILNYRNPETGGYLAKEALRMSKEERDWNTTQQEQENRRLIYVAITRGVYKCFIYKNTYHKFNRSSLAAFTNALKANPAAATGIFITDIPELQPAPYRLVAETEEMNTPLFAADFKLADENWKKLSYTGISAHGDNIPKERSADFEDVYDDFVFSKLRFGAATGNLLHQLLEDVDFSKEDKWEEIIARTLKAYLPSANETYASLIRQLLQHVLRVPVTLGFDQFSLSDIPFYKRIAELEFDFPVKGLSTALLTSLAGEGKEIYTRTFEGRPLEGIMNGKIDLFFEHRGRFYILDWKSNYLGYHLEHYNKEALLQAMNENNYHLQYLIYTVAVKKYLESRMPDFNYEKHFGGVIYLFLRGVREGSDSGIFTARPSLKKIEALAQMLYKET